jgi:hypothetical protein
MRHALAACAAVVILLAPGSSLAAAKTEFHSRTEVIEWMDKYRAKPEPAKVPDAIRALSKAGALRDPDGAGFPVGFLAGVLAADPARAEALAARIPPLPASDQWIVVRAVAYSSLPEWKIILRRLSAQLPAREAMIDAYIKGKLPTLDAIELDRDPTFMEKVRMQFNRKPPAPKVSYANNPELLDTLWGVYFATGAQKPVWRIVTMLPWSKDHDSIERLSIGSAAKYTLANNAARYPDLLALIKDIAPSQPDATKKILAEVIEAAETMETTNIKKQQLALIEDFKRRGPGYRRDVALWGQLGQGAISVGCIAAATLSFTALGLPCVIGGAASSAALNYFASQ